MARRVPVNLLGEPPTAAKLSEWATRAAQEREAHFRMKTRWTLWTIAVAVVAVGVGVMFGGDGITFGCAIAVVAVMFRGYVGGACDWTGLEERDFEPASPWLARSVLEAVELDPRVDAYRRAVVAQGRPMTAIEAIEFGHWRDRDFENEQRMSALTSKEPLVPAENKSTGTADSAWVEHAYPLQQLSVRIQGTRHSDPSALIGQLEQVVARLRNGDKAGAEHDDDFGYEFALVSSDKGPSLFSAACASA